MRSTVFHIPLIALLMPCYKTVASVSQLSVYIYIYICMYVNYTHPHECTVPSNK